MFEDIRLPEVDEADCRLTTTELIKLNAAIQVGDLLRSCVVVADDYAQIDVSSLSKEQVLDYRAALNLLEDNSREGNPQFEPAATWGVREDVLEAVRTAIRNVPLDS